MYGGDVTRPSEGALVRLPGEERFVQVGASVPSPDGALLFVASEEPGQYRQVSLTIAELSEVETLAADGQADSTELLAAMWSEWMGSAAANTNGAAMISSALTPYPHQHQAVYQRMLPQPMLRFLLGDEPGTGKTIMAGLYAREAQRLGIVNRCLVVCPAHLVTKWQADFDRFLGGGLDRVDNLSVKNKAFQNGMYAGRGFWVVSLELAAMNSAVLEAIHPDNASWDLVVFDEAHRLTPSAETYYRVGRTLAQTPRALLMTATPHRGNEWLFRSLLHLVDPEVFPEVSPDDTDLPAIKPGPMHFLRRMKEELRDHENNRLFHDRFAYNEKVPLSSKEQPFYQQALALVDGYFPQEAKTLGRMVYGKRAASCLYSLAETLRRRRDNMGTLSEPEAAREPRWGDPQEDDPAARDHAKVIYAGSTASRDEKKALGGLLEQIDAFLNDPAHTSPAGVSNKWPRMVDKCLTPHGITPGSDKQLVVFTEYADTADWLRDQFRAEGFTCERYSGRDNHATRDEVRARFMAGEFQVIVSTDAGNEGIDLQSAQVLVNWDIPWSLVTLEQRMGRIHRVGQNDDVHLFNLITVGTLEGDTYAKLLDRLVEAAADMKGKMFDCLSLVGEQLFDGKADVPLAALYEGGLPAERAKAAIEVITAEQLRQAAEEELARERINTYEDTDLRDAIKAMQDEQIEQINPHVVENYLSRIADAGLIVKAKSSAGVEGGLFRLAGTDRMRLPKHLPATDPDGRTLVATLGTLKMAAVKAGSVGASRAIDLSPATDAFRSLVGSTLDLLRPSLFRGGVLEDATSVTDYSLFVFEVPVSEGTRKVRWRHLIRVDATGAREVRFDLLNNLTSIVTSAPCGYHDGELLKAHTAAVTARDERRDLRERVLEQWHAAAATQLRDLPRTLSRDVQTAAERVEVRQRATRAVEARASALKAASDLTVSEPQMVGWCKVVAAGLPETPQEKDSERISMTHVKKLLTAAGWHVSDVSTELVGYDLLARRGYVQRCVEVKGVWGAASSEGIRLTGGEFARAGILGDDYWLYVVDQCHDGAGTLATVIRNPAEAFAGQTRDVPVLAIPGTTLMAAPTAPAT
jgi:superfamily II DNA or RNA helicase